MEDALLNIENTIAALESDLESLFSKRLSQSFQDNNVAPDSIDAIYLRLEGREVKDHSLMQELVNFNVKLVKERIKQYIAKIKEIQNPSKNTVELNKDASKRVLRNAMFDVNESMDALFLQHGQPFEIGFVQITTTVPSGRFSSGNDPPLEVNPGHIMLAPESTNLIAPRSTVTFGSIPGSLLSIKISFTFMQNF
ncbi:hypothetical protein O9G_001308 [Rozella allomycis CSF55]|uniref:Exosome complex protein n=1 Tax=Rozella allomycis (strain CSF55) TaxID=988480 RepID=A0A075AQ83_ROZAC|nr:hypothetical protein O9G_001308 [Rozella allomycis CSF55]|eukprot:EPZ32406.1 hypothetical protein O9G_001308 [Rozella allomycis CSF55]